MNDQNLASDDSKQKVASSTVATKEAEPVVTIEPLVSPSETEPKLHPEVEAAGVKIVDEKPKVTEEHLKIGLSHAKESTPVATEPTGKIQYPISESDAKKALKTHQKVKQSIAWLALSVLRQIDMMRGGSIND
jgi:hypothetical protein